MRVISAYEYAESVGKGKYFFVMEFLGFPLHSKFY